MNELVFIDTEVDENTNKVIDFGAISDENEKIHTNNPNEFSRFISNQKYIVGHNILDHDLKFCSKLISTPFLSIDTLYISPILFPQKPYHKLIKDYKLNSDQLNNPLNDAILARNLFYDEINAFSNLSSELKKIFASLLRDNKYFEGFFSFVDAEYSYDIKGDIKAYFKGKICENASLSYFINEMPIELAYSLAIISTGDPHSITPAWVTKKFPNVEKISKALLSTPCSTGCDYCNNNLNATKALNDIFGYKEFRSYNGEPLQEQAATAAIQGKSLLAIFPTGGGKSITFQLPALLAGKTSRSLTVVISPLQSLMKDQVDNLESRGIVDAVTINGLLNPFERKEAIERVANGLASILYISPESLRSKTIEKLLISRDIARFVIDEAHCFSAWGQDFRVDYLYIGEFIRKIEKSKGNNTKIPVSCFTATAKQKVISDIQDYFKDELDLTLELFATSATRQNLHYKVIYVENDPEKYNNIRQLISVKNCPTIIYTSKTKTTLELAKRLRDDGYRALPFNGKMESADKVENQEKFINDEVQIMVATSAFGMGVDKKDVGLVIHYEISNSLENYIQEAGRAGRDQSINADCYVLFNEIDLNKHFTLLNQTKISINDIQNVWSAIKRFSKNRAEIRKSPLEIAREAGWDDTVQDCEMRVKTAIAALENAGYITRGNNVPHIYATSVCVNSVIEANAMIENATTLTQSDKIIAKRIMQIIIPEKFTAITRDIDESRIDYIADTLGYETKDVATSVNHLREIGVLKDESDITCLIKNKGNIKETFDTYVRLEKYLFSYIVEGNQELKIREINDAAINEQDIKNSTEKKINEIKNFWTISGYIKKNYDEEDRYCGFVPQSSLDHIERMINKRLSISKFVVSYILSLASNDNKNVENISFSVVELEEEFNAKKSDKNDYCSVEDIQNALLYLSRTGVLDIDGGFTVSYNSMSIRRKINDNKIRYKKEDYNKLNDFYRNKIQQVHIVGEFAKMMVSNIDEALKFVQDYFQLEYKQFISKYFKGNRKGEINRNITPKKYEEMFGTLSNKQLEIIEDNESKYIAVAAGPGSGKTKLLVHKLASLLQLEDVKHEQLLMLTFSRAAATEFKYRLKGLIGSSAHYVEIKTFHSYCFDLIGQIGNEKNMDNVVKQATRMISDGDVEKERIIKAVLVIDEAQDMNEDEFDLVKSLIEINEDMRIIAVGDDDQNIYEFRGSDSKYFESLISEYGAKRYELIDNYRSKSKIIDFSNNFVHLVPDRMKKTDIVSFYNDEPGLVSFVKHTSDNMIEPVVNNFLENRNQGKSCILTWTNEEAATIYGLLVKKGVKAKFIQGNSKENIYFCDLAETRAFLKYVSKKCVSPIISKEIWEEAKDKFKNKYSDSSICYIVLNMCKKFEAQNDKLFLSDLKEYINESYVDDFIEEDSDLITVSTIHKSKGHEYDNVYLISGKQNPPNYETFKVYYVGFTRAKKNLYIHYNNDFFDKYNSGENYSFVLDNTIYPEPEEIILPLSYADVNLGFFKDKKNLMRKLYSGIELSISIPFGNAIIDKKRTGVFVLSKKGKIILESYMSRGYEIVNGRIRYVVAYRFDDCEEEKVVLLPELNLKRQ